MTARVIREFYMPSPSRVSGSDDWWHAGVQLLEGGYVILQLFCNGEQKAESVFHLDKE